MQPAEQSHMIITLNGEPFELDEPLSVTALLAQLDIDPRRVAVEHNLTILKRRRFPRGRRRRRATASRSSTSSAAADDRHRSAILAWI